ncbi:MAG: putative toxin-antitoxin system toxin component, PIN family [Oligoflexia bacterium]|nr:putative toxin-antitoxin system toxin component, PIN family [Oligoflexia bacterium]
MKNPFTVCLDSNVIISGIVFGGLPLRLLEMALSRQYHLVLGTNIISEVSGKLVSKLGLSPSEVSTVLDDLKNVASLFVPVGDMEIISHVKDNLVLEVAINAGCDILVTGDKKHLLPLISVQGVKIESPAQFISRFKK